MKQYNADNTELLWQPIRGSMTLFSDAIVSRTMSPSSLTTRTCSTKKCSTKLPGEYLFKTCNRCRAKDLERKCCKRARRVDKDASNCSVCLPHNQEASGSAGSCAEHEDIIDRDSDKGHKARLNLH
ncbi:hypothetical protein PM082_023559 [Marasmius tenuissimus]|nr:hypothetical protein PM082_023559 [Marasmius tenuissimus]